jgi:CBS domain-containing protein
MPKQPTDSQTTVPAQVLEFLEGIMPFKELSHETLTTLARQCIIDFFPKNTLIFKQDMTEVTHLFIIQKGGVRSFLKNADGEESLKDFRGEGEYFGALPLLQNTKANLNVETVEDTFCFLFPKSAFSELIQSEPKATAFFLKSLSKKLVNSVYKEFRQHKISNRSENAFYLFTTRVNDIQTTPKTIPATDTVQKAAAIMAKLHIGSLLVEEAGDITGIVTDNDLRTKVVAQGLDYATPVKAIMASPVRTIQNHSSCFDALITMMTHGLHHLAVENKGKISGIVTTHDIMVVQGTSPLYLFREIRGQQTIEGLYPLAGKIPMVVRSLIEDGAKANNITKMITIINDQILDRLLTLLTEKLGPAPVKFSWLLFGSEGRQEQTFLTDQDNALLYEDSSDPGEQEKITAYFDEFSKEAITHLEKCGFPLCPGNIMATNPDLRQNSSDWQESFRKLIKVPDVQQILHSTIYFDFRTGFGDESLAGKLRDYLCKTIPKNELFLFHLANDCLQARPPLSFFRNFIVEKDGVHKNRLNLKQNGLTPFVNFARVLSLKHGIAESNTIGRLQHLVERQLLSPEFHSEIVEAYEFIMHIRLIHQLHQIEEGLPPDNFVDPARLSDLEKQTLKEAFEIIRRMQTSIRQEFRINEV